MIKFDWMHIPMRYFYFDTETSKVWAEISVESLAMTTAIYVVSPSQKFLTLEGAKEHIENTHSIYGKVEREEQQENKNPHPD